MPLGSYRILSESKYIGTHSGSASLKIAPESITSMQSIPITMSSYGYGKGMPHFAKGLVFEKTANNMYWTHDGDFERNGRALGPDDYFHYGNWIKAATNYGPNSWNRVALPPRTSASEAIESFEPIHLTSHIEDTPLNKPIHIFYMRGLRINEAGKKLSELENHRQHINSYLRTEDGRELPASLMNSGGKPTEIDDIVVGGLPSYALYGVVRSRLYGGTKRGRVLLKAAEDVYERIATEARYFGIDAYDLMDTMLAEELAHIWLGDIDREGNSIKIEEAAKEVVLKHYLRLAKGAEGDQKKRSLKERRYKQAWVKKVDLETVDRYSKKGSFYKQLYLENKSDLEYALTEEAVEKGYRGRAAQEYVSNRLEEIGEEADKDNRMSRLEKIAEGSDSKSEPESETNAEPQAA